MWNDPVYQMLNPQTGILQMRALLIAALTTLALGGPTLAQQSGTPEDRKACAPSVQKFCADSIQGGDFAVLACLQQNRSRIAPACQQVLIRYGQ
jgi:hypothetical protein